MRWTASLLLPLLVTLAGCPTAPPDVDAITDRRVVIPEPPAASEGVQIVMDDFTVPPGSEVMWCYVAAWSPDEDTLINSFKGWQNIEGGGHHLVALGAQVPYEPGYNFDCTNIESMQSLEPLVLPEPGDTSYLPDGYAVRVAAGSNVIIQSHYINYTAQEMVVRDVVHLGFYQGDDAIEASYLILNHGALDVAPGESSAEVTCQLPVSATPYKLVNLLGHMHEWGAAIDISHQPQGGDWDVIYDVPDWAPEYRDLPPTNVWEAEDPFVIEGGDRFRVRCDFDNGTAENIRFPSEMCTSVALYFPAAENGMIVCDEDGGRAD